MGHVLILKTQQGRFAMLLGPASLSCPLEADDHVKKA